MKKTIIFLFVTMFIIIALHQKNNITIPKSSIRFRIIANSNNPKDQALKWQVNERILPILNQIGKKKSLDDSRRAIKDNLPEIKNELDKFNVNYKINFGNNYFPQKEYKSIKYPEGEYESLVITLGSGKGDNWWCVLFPPLCLMEAKKEDIDDVTYTSYINEIINTYI